MRRLLRNTFTLCIPVLVVVLVNEISRYTNVVDHAIVNGYKTITSAKADETQCTWKCHYNTNHCKAHHVKFARNHFELTDELYFGVINTLQDSGSYAFANVLIFALIWPLLLIILFIKILNLKSTLSQIKK